MFTLSVISLHMLHIVGLFHQFQMHLFTFLVVSPVVLAQRVVLFHFYNSKFTFDSVDNTFSNRNFGAHFRVEFGQVLLEMAEMVFVALFDFAYLG